MVLFTRSLVVAFLASQVVACGKGMLPNEAKDSDESGSSEMEIADSSPSDTTGGTGSVNLSFLSEMSSPISLAEEAATPAPVTPAAPLEIKIGDSIVVSTARFSIAKIKLKANHEVSTDEERAEKMEKAKDETEDREYEDVVMPEVRGKKDMVMEKAKEHKDEYRGRDKERMERDSKHDRSIKFKGPFIYNAVLGKFEGDAPKVDLTDGSYRRVEFQLKRNHVAADSDPILGQTFIIQGSVKIGENTVPFNISYHISENFRLRGDSAFIVSPGEDNELAIIFNLTKWFDGIDFSKATVADGKITVNKNTNQDLLHALKRNIKKHVRFGKDLSKTSKPAEVVTAGVGEP